MVELRKIDKSNYRECLQLKVLASQEKFVASNLFSLAQAWVFYETTHPFAIYADGTMVGFIMACYASESDRHEIWRLMIDEKYQAKGYGREALLLGMKFLRDTYGATKIYLSFEPENSVAEKLYTSLGFRRTGEMDGGEVVACCADGADDGN